VDPYAGRVLRYQYAPARARATRATPPPSRAIGSIVLVSPLLSAMTPAGTSVDVVVAGGTVVVINVVVVGGTVVVINVVVVVTGGFVVVGAGGIVVGAGGIVVGVGGIVVGVGGMVVGAGGDASTIKVKDELPPTSSKNV
jgi:hypothetical protein